MITLEEKINEISTLRETCSNGEAHDIKPFVYHGKTSDFEDVCVKCGGFRLHPEGIYTRMGLILYIDSDRYDALLEYCDSIRERANVKDLSI